jgi:peptidoglycan/xylan/chitin deacetylase (PgdA/CDA1 family)
MPRPLVLCYHAVSAEWSHLLAVTPTAFDRQLRSLVRRGYRPVGAAEALGGRGRLLHVTFDDAFANIACAVPILERLGVPATVFAVTAFADDGRVFDVPELAGELAANPAHLATMSWDQLRELAARGFEIGSHTVTHPHLPQLSDAELDRELRDSRSRLEDELSRPCALLAYPYGEHDARVHACVRRAGYRAAFVLRSGAEQGNPFAVPRVDLYRRDTLLRTTLKTSAASRPALALSALVRSMSGR